ncbi:MAG: Gfo/Idh/MocA family oxidoreductase [Thermoguttaceae bacterium]|nr:Gfo/Idh/MocA family oxidoreductase [Thermoguttaceae bacterium]
MKKMNRREFFGASALTLSSLLVSSPFVLAEPPKDKLRIALVGCGGRGSFLTTFFPNIPNAELVALCDADFARLAETCKKVPDAKNAGSDMRAVFDDPDVDAVMIATCNHWHVLAAIWAMQAGKNVYLEKPVCLNFCEGEQLVAAAKKYGKLIQIGTQMRSDPVHHPEAKRFLHEEKALGKIKSVRVSRFFARNAIGKRATPLVPPETVDFNMWLGPAPETPIYRNSLHYDWHWDWRTGNGETGNWGAHLLDDCRNDVFFDQIGAPKRVMSVGARIGYDDAGDSPNEFAIFFDTGLIPVVFCISNLPDKANPKTTGACAGPTSGYTVFCEGGRYEKHWGGAVAFDENGEQIREFTATAEHIGPGPHIQNFVDCVLQNAPEKLTAPLKVGIDTATWYNGANTSFRLGEPYSKKDALDLVDDEETFATALDDIEKHLDAQGLKMNADTFRASRFLEYDGTAGIKGEYADAAKKLLTIDYREPFVVPTFN